MRFEITGDRTTIGRTRDNEIVLQDPAVSSHHCELVSDRTGLVVRDLNSSNGTYVNGRRMQAGPLYDGDAIKIGQYQGRIAVRRLDGKPLKAPGAMGPAVFVAVAVAVVVLGGGLALFVLKGRQDADRTLLATYDTKAKELLALDPCAPLDEAARALRIIERSLGQPDLGKRGKPLVAAQKKTNEGVLEKSKDREPKLSQALEKASGAITKQKENLGKLREFPAQLNDAAAAGELRALESLFAARAQKGEEYVELFRKHEAQVKEWNELLDRLTRRGDREAYDALDGYRFKPEPAKVAEECQKELGKSHSEGLLKLAAIVL